MLIRYLLPNLKCLRTNIIVEFLFFLYFENLVNETIIFLKNNTDKNHNEYFLKYYPKNNNGLPHVRGHLDDFGAKYAQCIVLMYIGVENK